MLSPRIRRNRERLACTECRRRKLRCDRRAPCSSCTRRGDNASCSYGVAVSGSADTLDHERDLRVQAEARLAHLEQLVHQLARQNVPNSAGSAPGSETWAKDRADADYGVSRPKSCESEDSAYNGGTHWSAMLDDIQALRSVVYSGDAGDSGSDSTLSGGGTSEAGILFGGQSCGARSIDDVLRGHLPSRQDADRLISAYFRSLSVAAPFVHTQQFRRQYQAFWNNPSATPSLWLSMLFSIFHNATHALKIGQKLTGLGADHRFSIAAAQCLVVGEYYHARRFAVEALLLYAQALCVTSRELPPDIGPIFGVLIRLATTMGYHRDPEKQLAISPFEKEMRRRTWSLCMQLDLLTSFHLGLPSNIQFPTWDTEPPSSLLDSQFDEDTVTMPPPMPHTEMAGMPFYIAKHKLMVVFDKILRHVLTVRTGMATEDELVALDKEIRDVRASLPEVLARRPISECVVEQPSLIVTRLCVSFLYNKCLCVLHRPYVARGRAHSVRECYAAASALVEDFVDGYEECKPGGVLETEQWFMTSITWHDFLLGATALCMLLCARSEGGECTSAGRIATVELLGRARVLCLEKVEGRNRDTGRVLSVIDATIRQFGGDYVEGPSRVAVDAPLPSVGGAEGVVGVVDTAWPWIDSVGGPVDDPEWAYLDRFLDLRSLDAWADG